MPRLRCRARRTVHPARPRQDRPPSPLRRRGGRHQAAGESRPADPQQAAELATVLAGLPRLTPEEVEAGRSPAGGFTRAQLAAWGVPWPRQPDGSVPCYAARTAPMPADTALMAVTKRADLTKGTAVIVAGRAAQEEWETKDGQKRRSVKVTADEIAPSLRFATCKVAKAERSRPAAGNGGRGQGGADPWASGTPGTYTDEPPF